MARQNHRTLITAAVFAVTTAASLALAPAAGAQAADGGPVYRFGVVPQQSGSKLSRLWSPILAYLEQRTGYRLQFATARNIPTFEKRLRNDKYDFAYMNPYHYVTFHKESGYRAFATAKGKRLKGILVVRKDSPYQSLKDLDGKGVAVPAHAFAADLVMRAQFQNLGESVDIHDVASHDSSYRNVADGRYAAGGGVLRTFRATAPSVRNELRILWTSPGFTPHAFAASPSVPPEVVKRVQKAMLEMEDDPEGKALLKAIRLKGVIAARDSDWNDVRALNLQ